MNNYSSFLKNFSGFFFKEQLKHLILHITNFCNFRCAHCFVDFETKKRDLKIEHYEKLSNKFKDYEKGFADPTVDQRNIPHPPSYVSWRSPVAIVALSNFNSVKIFATATG